MVTLIVPPVIVAPANKLNGSDCGCAEIVDIDVCLETFEIMGEVGGPVAVAHAIAGRFKEGDMTDVDACGRDNAREYSSR
jgi:hypothetical protein